MSVISDKWVLEILKDGGDKVLTFAGCLEKYYPVISVNWNTDTKKKYKYNYDNIILPALKNHDFKGIDEYVQEDFEDAISFIRENGYYDNSEKFFYSEGMIRTFERLIYVVIYQGSVFGACENYFYATRFSINISQKMEEGVFPTTHEQLVLKKSLNTAQDRKIAKYFFSEKDIYEFGAELGVLLMDALGLRNAEVCALNFGDIQPIGNSQKCFVAWIYKTTVGHSSLMKSSGKTKNVGRLVPIPDKILGLLLEKRKIVEKYLQGDEDINQMPIVNLGQLNQNNYRIRCKTQDITRAAKVVFEKLNFKAEELALVDKVLKQDYFDDHTGELLKEKEASAYLMRRDFATKCKILGISETDIKYLMGHEIDDVYVERSDYVDDEKMLMLWEKLHGRPLLNIISGEKNILKIAVPAKKKVKIFVRAKEPGREISLKICGDTEKVKMERFDSLETHEYGRTIDILEEYQSIILMGGESRQDYSD